MKTHHDNFKPLSPWKRYTALLPVALAPLALIGFSLRPAVEYVAMTSDLEEARDRAVEADDLAGFLATFGDDGPPTQQYEALLGILEKRVPHGFEPTLFLERVVRATEGIDLVLDAVSPAGDTNLELPVGDLFVFQRSVSLQGRGRLDDLPRFFSALHRQGQPVGVLQAKLDALDDGMRFDFTLELAVFHLAEPVISGDLEDLMLDDLPDDV